MADPTSRSRDALVCLAAGGEWPMFIDRDATRDELASWLGPWARPPRPGDGPPAGIITFAADVGLAPGRSPAKPDVGCPCASSLVERIPGGFRLAQRGYEVRVERRDGRDVAAVRCGPPYARTAARTAIRMLACRRVVAGGGLALHASSVRNRGGLFAFAGPSGAGKTSAAMAFPPADRLDQDLVLIAGEGGRWVRLDMFDEYEPSRFAPGEGAGLPVRAVLAPAAGASFGLEHLAGSDAVRACLHVPAGWGAAEMPALMERAEALAVSVPVARMKWALGEDLPALIEAALQ